MGACEINFDGIVGPTHNYAGLSFGNVASMRHKSSVSHPKQAALEGLAKMRLLRSLGVKQAGVVLRYVVQARDRGLGVVLITHNPHHAYPVGDRFLLLKRGAALGSYEKDEIDLPELTRQMAGGAELAALQHELERVE